MKDVDRLLKQSFLHRGKAAPTAPPIEIQERHEAGREHWVFENCRWWVKNEQRNQPEA